MTDSITRAVALAGEGFDDFTPEQMAEVLERAEAEQGFPVTRANVFQMRLNGARAQRRNAAALAALAPTAATWINKELSKVEFTEGMYGSGRMTNTNDQPEGYMGE